MRLSIIGSVMIVLASDRVSTFFCRCSKCDDERPLSLLQL